MLTVAPQVKIKR